MRRSLIAESIQAMAAVAAIAAARSEQDPPRQCEIAWNDLITHERHHSQPWASHSPGKEGDDKPRNRQSSVSNTLSVPTVRALAPRARRMVKRRFRVSLAAAAPTARIRIAGIPSPAVRPPSAGPIGTDCGSPSQVAGRVARGAEAADPVGGSLPHYLTLLDPERLVRITMLRPAGHGVREQLASARTPSYPITERFGYRAASSGCCAASWSSAGETAVSPAAGSSATPGGTMAGTASDVGWSQVTTMVCLRQSSHRSRSRSLSEGLSARTAVRTVLRSASRSTSATMLDAASRKVRNSADETNTDRRRHRCSGAALKASRRRCAAGSRRLHRGVERAAVGDERLPRIIMSRSAARATVGLWVTMSRAAPACRCSRSTG